MDFPWGEENLMKAKLFENLSVCRNVGKYSLWFLQVLQHKQLNARVAVIIIMIWPLWGNVKLYVIFVIKENFMAA